MLLAPILIPHFTLHLRRVLFSFVPPAAAKKGDARLENATAAGRKFCLLAWKGECENPIPVESYQVYVSHGIWRSRFPITV